MKYELPPDYKIVTSYKHPNFYRSHVIVCEIENKDIVAFCEFDYDHTVPVEIHQVSKFDLTLPKPNTTSDK